MRWNEVISMSEILKKLRSRGHWKIIIHPGTFVEQRVGNISDLYPILQKISVQLRGWDFPHLDVHTPLHKEKDWIEQSSKWNQYFELWRFYQSGQFFASIGMEEDWLDQNHDWPLPQDWKPESYLGVENTIFQFTEILEFASRLSLTQAGDESMHLEIDLKGLEGRYLKLKSRRVGSSNLRDKRAELAEFPYRFDLSKTELITTSKELALKPATELFQHFGWDPGQEVLRDIQAELLQRGSQVADRG